MSKYEREFFIKGKLVPKQRVRVAGGRAFTPKKTKGFESWVRICYMENWGDHPVMQGPLAATIRVVMSRPKAHYRTGKYAGILKEGIPEWVTRTPDLDNLAKAILDALNEIAYKDDSQIVSLQISKRFGQETITHVVLHGLR